MLAMRGGVAVGGLLTGAIAVGGLLTGATVTLIGVPSALFANGALAILAHAPIARSWRHVVPPSPDNPIPT